MLIRHFRFAETLFEDWEAQYVPELQSEPKGSRRRAAWVAFITDPRHAELRAQLEGLLEPGEQVEELLPTVWNQLCQNDGKGEEMM